jgi:hypothetical protein
MMTMSDTRFWQWGVDTCVCSTGDRLECLGSPLFAWGYMHPYRTGAGSADQLGKAELKLMGWPKYM